MQKENTSHNKLSPIKVILVPCGKSYVGLSPTNLTSVLNIQGIPTSWRMSSTDFSSRSDKKQPRSPQSWPTTTAYSTKTPRRRSRWLHNRPKGTKKDASLSSHSRPYTNWHKEIRLRDVTLMYKSVNNLLPAYISCKIGKRSTSHVYNLRNSEDLNLPSRRTAAAQRGFFYKVAKAWNSLSNTRTARSLRSFKKHAKAELAKKKDTGISTYNYRILWLLIWKW